jgi:ribosomal protein L21E
MISEIKAVNDNTKVSLIIGMLGFFIVGIGVVRIILRRQLFKNGIRVPGTVVRIDESFEDGKPMYHPVFTYQTVKGETITNRRAIGSNPTSFSVGEKVKIIYDPTEKDNYIVDNFRGNIVGYLIAAAGIIVILAAFSI